jgi:NAD(P) transhydrogenase subunit alpha
VTSTALVQMRPGTVVVDVAASALGGNVEGSVDGETIVTPEGVTIVGAGNLPAEVPGAASAAFSRNACALLAHVVQDGRLVVDLGDEIQAGVVVTHDGTVVHPAVAGLVGESHGGASR